MKIPHTLFKNYLLISAAFLMYLPVITFAQNAPPIQWDKTFGGSNADELITVKQTSDGGFILGGKSLTGISGDKSQASVGNFDYWVLKTDRNGIKIWDKTIGGSDSDILMDLQQTSDGGYILGGYSSSNISGNKSQNSLGNFDYWIVKLDSSGTILWDKTFGGVAEDRLNSLQQTADGGFILGGQSKSGISVDKSQASRGNFDYWILKLDSNGTKVWDKTLGGSDSDILMDLQQTADGGYIVGGTSHSGLSGDKSEPSKGGGDFWLLKLDANGLITWDKTFGGLNSDILFSLQQTSNGEYIIGGQSDSDISGDKTQASQGFYDYWVIKVDTSGSKVWDKTFGGSNTDFFYCLKQTADGGFILGGSTDSGISIDKSQGSKGSYDFWILKLNSSGSKVWDKTIGASMVDYFFYLEQTADNGYILGGKSISGINGDKTQPGKGGFDYWIVKLAPEVLGVKEAKGDFDISIFPNPNQGKFSLQLNNISNPKVEVSVSDFLGRIILQKVLPVGNRQVSEELEIKAAKGMYLLKIKAGNKTTTRKLVVE